MSSAIVVLPRYGLSFDSGVTIACTPLNRCRRLPVWPGRNPGLGEMTTNYQADAQAYHGKKLFGTGVFLFVWGLIWFRAPGLLSPHPLSERHGMTNVIDRASIVIGVCLAAYGLLVWRNAFRKLSLANYVIVLACAPVLLLGASKMKEWEYFLDQQRESWILNPLGVEVIHLTIFVCILFLGIGWADSTYLRERFHALMRSSRFVK